MRNISEITLNVCILMGNFEEYMRFEFNLIFSNYNVMFLLLSIVNLYLFTIFSKTCFLKLNVLYL